ncbi:pilus assembly protein [Hazenella sp. IB182353]|uniref:TadE/TadG family type IV pilus assembly protein n=1 Tax=Polycladospora coralii TaxID=2771432 RepID=UPI0017462942|nr:TadE family protein [Polycladospora coralii]MBS7531744.1 pilus assembly protein [Polycladospora coralii]
MKPVFRLLKNDKGSATVEFLTVMPLVVFMCLFVWQFYVAGIAIMETNNLVREGVRIAAESKNEKKEEKRGMKVFPVRDNFKLETYDVVYKKDKVRIKAETSIEYVFLPFPPFTYKTSAQAPIIE